MQHLHQFMSTCTYYLRMIYVQDAADMFAVGYALHERHMLHLHCYAHTHIKSSSTARWHSDLTFFMLLRRRVGMYCTTAILSTVPGNSCCSACRLLITLPILHCMTQQEKANCHPLPPSLHACLEYSLIPAFNPSPLFPEALGSQAGMLPMNKPAIVCTEHLEFMQRVQLHHIGILLRKQMQHILSTSNRLGEY